VTDLPVRKLSHLVQLDLEIDPDIRGVTSDSRKVQPGFLFAALPGVNTDGAQFIAMAIEKGAAAVLAPEGAADQSVPVIRTSDVRRSFALAAANYWGAQPPVVVAVTGTNGKTSVATFCRQIFTRLGRKAASLGTLGLQLADEDLTGPGLTTPDAEAVARMAAELAARGVTHLAIEASSHGLDQRRIDGLQLTAAGFTNLTQDHLDYHQTMEIYREAKLRLFTRLLPHSGTAVLNADSPDFAAFATAAYLRGQTIFAVGEEGHTLRQLSREPEPYGQLLNLQHEGVTYQVRLPLAGAFQASNALVAAGLCIAAGEEPAAVIEALAHLVGAPGRLQRIGASASGGEAYVDYAHTPDGLETVLKALRPHTRGRLIVVFGAGGDRDRAKRPLMGRAAAELADLAIVTDDNPRSEDPAFIRSQVMQGCPNALEVGDRRAAIRAGVEQLRDGDILVVAGKGHEQGQTMAGVVHPFDDVAETAEALSCREGEVRHG
jgi:UDP-N-acetylmuramoyl-L-alanyl-D-glutamate--2,6-diaminopimelate ligase